MVFSPVGLRMSILTVSLFILLMAGDSLSEQEALEPNCTGVKDFEACLGNTDNFCPTNISCQCKNEKPFCRCEYFRLDWKEYWYMGPKCNHLWNTLNFILVATLPALVLVILVVAVTFYCVSLSKSKKAGSQSNPPYREAWRNPGFTAEEADNSQHFYQPRDNSDWVRQIPKAMVRRPVFDVPAPGHLDSYSPMPPQPSRRPAADLSPNQRPPYEQFGYAGQDLPHLDYAEERRQYWKH